MLPASFYFLRHGETDWNREERLQGHTDIPLNETGRAQAQAAAPLMGALPFDRIIASPLSRAHETARLVNAGGKPLHLDAGLKERHFGTLEGVVFSDAQAMRRKLAEEGLPIEDTGYPCPPGGETYDAFRDRVLGALRGNMERYAGEKLLFVAHGGVYRVLRRSLLGDIAQSANVHPYLFEKSSDGWRLESLL
jgi:probable phosphoglycerate mutase